MSAPHDTTGPAPPSAAHPPSPRRRRNPDLGWLAFTVAAFVLLGANGLIGALVLWAVHVAADPPPPLVAAAAAVTLAVAGVTWFASGVPALEDVFAAARRPVASLVAVVGVLALVTAAWRASGPADGPVVDLDDAARRGRQAVTALVQPRVMRAGRLPEVATMRSLALVTVVLIHALPPEFGADRSAIDRWLGDVTRAAVPAFVFASGYLAARHPLPEGWRRRRLERLVVPYLVASGIALVLRASSDAFPPLETPIADLLLGATFGPYYFVFLLVVLTVVAPPLLRLQGRRLLLALVVAVVAQVGVEVLGGPLFWRVRNPLLWLAFYLAGVVAWRARDRLLPWTVWWPALLLVWSVLAAGIAVLPDDTVPRDLLTLAAAWTMLAVLWSVGRRAHALPAVAWWIDARTYPLYLYHLPFVLVVAGPYGSTALSLGAVAGWAAGLIGAASVIVVGRHLLGPRSELLLGA
jgi:peptidoglycan/LPS O-acetylase OafA/YrhL